MKNTNAIREHAAALKTEVDGEILRGVCKTAQEGDYDEDGTYSGPGVDLYVFNLARVSNEIGLFLRATNEGDPE